MENDLIQNMISSIIFIVTWVIAKIAIRKSISKWKFKKIENRLRWNVQIRNIMVFILVLGLMLIWASALKTFALSIVVIASAIAIGCKEYIMCFLGGLLKAGTNHFAIGDTIVIANYRGEVIDHTPFTTTIFESGPGQEQSIYTGNKIIIPNSLLLSHPVINESHAGSYNLQQIHVRIPRGENWALIKEKLITAATKVCHDIIEKSQSEFNHLARRGGYNAPNASPIVTASFTDVESIDLYLRFPIQTSNKQQMDQEILMQVFGEELPKNIDES